MISRLALVRLAARGLRRQLKASWLVVLLIAFPVAVGSYLAVAARTVSEHGLTNSQLIGLGDAELIVRAGDFDAPVYAASGETLSNRPDFAANLVGFAERVEADNKTALAQWEFRDVDGFINSRSTRLDRVVAADWKRPGAANAFVAVEGRMPTSIGQLALDRRAAGRLNLALGDQLETTGGSTAEVVGLVRPFDVSSWSAPTVYLSDEIITPELLEQRPTFSFALGVSDIDRPELAELLNESELRAAGGSAIFITSNGTVDPLAHPDGYFDPGRRPEQAGSLVTAILLVEIGLLAAAAFVVRGRRRTADVSRLTALGATPAQVSSMMRFESGLLGLCGAVLGVVASLVLAVANHNLLVTVGGFVLPDEAGVAPSVRVQAWDLLLPSVLAVGAAVLAGWIPARRAARLPAQQARRGAATQQRLSLPWLLAGPALVVASLGAVYVSERLQDVVGARDETVSSLLVTGALLALVGAAVALAAALLDRLGDRGEGLPLSLRFGLRHMARNRTRSSVLAGGVAVITMTAVVFLTLFSVSDPDQQAVTADIKIARVASTGPGGPELDIGDLNLNDGSIDSGGPDLAGVRANVAFETEVPLHYVVDGEGARAGFNVSLTPDHPYGFALSGDGSAVVATPDLIAALDLGDEAEAALARPHTALVTSPFSRPQGNLWDAMDFGDAMARTPRTPVDVVAVDRPDLWGADIVALIGPGQAPGDYRADADTATSEWLIASPDGFSQNERKWLTQQPAVDIAAVPDPYGQNMAAQLMALAVVVLLVLIVTRLAAGLVAAESDGDTAVMKAVGARAAIRRRLLGAQVGVMTAVSVLIAVPLGLLFAWTFINVAVPSYYRPDLPDRPLLPAPLYFIALSLLLPLLAAGFVVLTSGSGRKALSRRRIT